MLHDTAPSTMLEGAAVSRTPSSFWYPSDFFDSLGPSTTFIETTVCDNVITVVTTCLQELGNRFSCTTFLVEQGPQQG